MTITEFWVILLIGLLAGIYLRGKLDNVWFKLKYRFWMRKQK